MRALLLLSALTISMFTASAAHACTVNLPVSMRIERGHAQGHISGIAVFSVESARHIADKQGDAYPWKASAAIIRTVRGSDLPATAEFERGWGSSACEWNRPPLPKKGDRWAVYFWKDRVGNYRPWLAMPVSEAREFDPAFPNGY